MEKLACQKETITSFSHDVLHFIKSLLSRRMFCLSTFFSQLDENWVLTLQTQLSHLH